MGKKVDYLFAKLQGRVDKWFTPWTFENLVSPRSSGARQEIPLGSDWRIRDFEGWLNFNTFRIFASFALVVLVVTFEFGHTSDSTSISFVGIAQTFMLLIYFSSCGSVQLVSFDDHLTYTGAWWRKYQFAWVELEEAKAKALPKGKRVLVIQPTVGGSVTLSQLGGLTRLSLLAGPAAVDLITQRINEEISCRKPLPDAT